MFRLILLRYVALVLPLCFMLSPLMLNTVYADDEAGLTGGIRREIIDYESGSPELSAYTGLEVSCNEKFFFNFNMRENFHDKSRSHTWNCEVKNISGSSDFLFGHYSLHFGSGLMMGKPSYRSIDPFSKKISISKDNIVSPATGGNPSYSFFGVLFNFHAESENSLMLFIPFFSNQRRFITPESYDEGVIDSSLFTLNSRYRREGNHTEPVNIINYGFITEAELLSIITLQIYLFNTDLKGDSGRDILWDRGKYSPEKGINLIRNGGCFFEYNDSCFSFFIEPAFSEMLSDSYIRGYGLAYGAGIGSPRLNFSIRGKNSSDDFHSEYSSGNRTPERIWEMKLGTRPDRCIESGLVLYSEKDLAPGYNRDYFEGSVIEEVYAKFRKGTIEINTDIRRKEHYSAERGDSAERLNSGMNVGLTDRIFLQLRGSLQRYSGNKTYLAGTGMKYLFLKNFIFSAGYTRIIVNGDIPHYAVITPATSFSTIEAFREPVHGVSACLKYRFLRDSFYLRFTAVKKRDETAGEAESGLTMFF